jgi:hypothetical protein
MQRRFPHALGAAALSGACLIASCVDPAADRAPGILVINNTPESIIVQHNGGSQTPINAGASQKIACSGEACLSLTLRSPICLYGYDLTPFFESDPDLAAGVLPVQVQMDYTLYMLPPGSHRPARTPPSAPEARLRPDSVEC